MGRSQADAGAGEWQGRREGPGDSALARLDSAEPPPPSAPQYHTPQRPKTDRSASVCETLIHEGYILYTFAEKNSKNV